jgi:hypothetical protein
LMGCRRCGARIALRTLGDAPLRAEAALLPLPRAGCSQGGQDVG